MKKILFILTSFFALNVSKALAAYNGAEETMKAIGGGVIDFSGSVTEAVARMSGNLIGNLLSFIGVVFMLIVLYGGFKWMTAMGNEKTVKEAQNLIVRATVGLIIIYSAYTITSFVMSNIPK